MATRIKCTGRDFVGLVNQYTGEPIETVMVVRKDGTCVFAAPDTYTPAGYAKSADEAYRLWCRQNGVDGVRKGDVIRCAYTGDVLELKHNEFGFYYAGGFDPRVFRPRDEYLNLVTMVGGKRTRKAYSKEVRVEKPAPKKPKTATHEINVDDEHMRRARAAMDASHFAPEKKTRVSMATGRRGRK